MKIGITEDYPVKPLLEKKLLKNLLLDNKNLHKSEILLAWRVKIDEAYLSKFKNLRFIIRYGSGYDNIDIDYLKKNRIHLFNNPDYAYRDVAETTLALIFNFVRRISEYNQLAIDTSRNFDKSFLGFDNQDSLQHMNIGIIGCGKIGSEVCRKISPFVSKIFYFDKRIVNFNKKFTNIYKKNLNFLIKNSDIISLHLDLNTKTKGFINENNLNLIKKPTILINASREELIDNYDYLFNAIKKNIISHVGLDISFNHSTTTNSKLIKAWKSKNQKYSNKIIINPHVAFYSKQSFYKMRIEAANMALKIIKNNNTTINKIL